MKSEELKEITQRLLQGGSVTKDEARGLAEYADLDELCEQADIICRHYCGDEVDSCSIVNARSGLCSEDCKWCAQSVKYNTGCDVYTSLPYAETLKAALDNQREGIKRFSLVTSGRGMTDRDIEQFCETYRQLSKDTGEYLCASMGLLTEPQLRKLHEAGVKRYHCNMESSDAHFRTLCTTHTPDDKRATIRAAKRAGMEICSGGIIGMGETMDQRIDFAFELAELGVDSVPINILNPIPGTPLENEALISEDDIIRTVAVFRFVLPKQSIRFAGGRMRLSEQSLRRMMRGGVNGVLMGDMLTTVSNTIEDDRKLFADTGWKF